MQRITPVVRELVLDPKRNKAWKFSRKMSREFQDHPPGRIWWVNTNTKVRTTVHDTVIDTESPSPPGLYVFAPIASQDTLADVIKEFQRLYSEEAACHTLPYYDMSPYQKLHVLFTGKNPEDVQMTYGEVMDVLEKRSPAAGKLIAHFSRAVEALLGISHECVESHSNLGIIKYSPNAGFTSHIDNMVRSGGTAGPVFTMSLGSNVAADKHFDMFPVIEHWRKPVRISTPIGSIIMMDGVSRVEWSHGIPSGDDTERWTIMLKFRQVSNTKVKYCRTLNMDIFASELCMHDPPADAGKSCLDRPTLDPTC